MVTLTTIGYGDLTPVINVGKIFTIVYILVGLGILLGFVNLVATHARKPIISRRGKKDKTEPAPSADEAAESPP